MREDEVQADAEGDHEHDQRRVHGVTQHGGDRARDEENRRQRIRQEAEDGRDAEPTRRGRRLVGSRRTKARERLARGQSFRHAPCLNAICAAVQGGCLIEPSTAQAVMGRRAL